MDTSNKPSLLQSIRSLLSQRYTLVLLTAAISIIIGYILGYKKGTIDQLEHIQNIFEIGHHADSLVRSANGMTEMLLNDSVRIYKEVEEMKTTLALTDLQMKEIVQIRFKQYTALQAWRSDTNSTRHRALETTLKNLRSQFDDLLTPDQRNKWQQVVKEKGMRTGR